jgi:hypothetical protein
MTQETLLLRQVHPSFVQAGHISSQAFSVTSQAFKPTPKDENKLSVYNGDKFSAKASHDHFINPGLNKSAGVVAVTPAECNIEGLRCEENNIPFDGHAIIDYTGLTSNQIDKKAKKLRTIAVNRGWLYGPV